ncbi:MULTISPECIES: S1C family serine protease [Aminobacterium]|jgi:hypothetical protein|uniref:S1C family serine protease n=1 Tax=Aminobacterium TaxID=81466 RepID=UPI00257F2999|nr:serine protease [Aminobacterium sp. UBA4834]
MRRNIKLLWLIFLLVFVAQRAEALTPIEIFQKYSKSVATVYSLDNGEKIHQGSGFFLEKSGLLLTNYHVIHDSQEIAVETEDGEFYIVRAIIAQDAEKDLALLGTATPSNKIVPVSFAPSVPPTGSEIVTIGTPEGFSHTLSNGILSSVKRGKDRDIVQFTAPVSPGSSGSPLFDKNGQVIGIVTAQMTQAQNLNFALTKTAIIEFLKTRPNKTDRDIELAKRKEAPKIYLSAVKGDILYRAGDCKDTYSYKLKAPFKSTLPGSLGVHFWFEFTEPCSFNYAYDQDGVEIYLPPEGVAKATFTGISVICKGDTVGFFRDPETDGFGWFVDNSNYNGGMYTIWTRAFKESEFFKFDKRKTVVWQKNAKVIVITYEGYNPNTEDILFLVIDSRQRNASPQTITVNRDRLPGYFELANGIIDIDALEINKNFPSEAVLRYDWDKEPVF